MVRIANISLTNPEINKMSPLRMWTPSWALLVRKRPDGPTIGFEMKARNQITIKTVPRVIDVFFASFIPILVTVVCNIDV